MAEPLLTIAPKTDSAQAAVRMDTISSVNQSLSDDTHPFADVLAGQAGEGGKVAATAGTPVADGISGKPDGQALSTDGKELPDATRLLELSGLPLQTADPDATSAADTQLDPALEVDASTGTDLTDADAEAAALLNAEAPVPETTEAAKQVVAPVNPALAQATVDAMPGDEQGGGTFGRRAAGSPAVLAAQSASNADGAEDLDPGVFQSAQESTRTVSVAVHQALQQRAEGKSHESNFGDLMRTAATGQAAEAGVRPEQTAATSLQGAVTASNTQPTTPALPTTAVAVPLRQAGWDQALGDQVQWMVGQKLQGAEIRLNPAHLGPMEVRIQVQHDQANITFSAQHGVVRDALEAAIPRLREMLGESGLNLANVQVSDQSFAQQRGDGREQSFLAGGQVPEASERGGADEAPVTLVTPLRSGGGSIDYFA